MPSETLQRTVRRIGAVLAILLAFTVLYLDRLVEDYGEPVVTDLLAVPFPWAVVLVALGYLTVSLLAGVARWFAPDDGEDGRDSEPAANRAEPGENQEGGDGDGTAE